MVFFFSKSEILTKSREGLHGIGHAENFNSMEYHLFKVDYYSENKTNKWLFNRLKDISNSIFSVLSSVMNKFMGFEKNRGSRYKVSLSVMQYQYRLQYA